jgi:methyltransferase
MLFIIFISIIILQRGAELAVARSNEKWMKGRGAVEFGQRHYPWIVAVHSSFFVCYLLEVIIYEKNLSPFWPILLILFFLTQAGRIWALISLGKYWNTKIIVLPGAEVVRRGPYRFIKHPNYAIVAAEFLVIPLMFQAYITAALFTLLNLVVLSVRIPAEEKALKHLTEYEDAFFRLRPGTNRDIKKV